MFILHLDDSSSVSAVGDPSNPAYNPIYVELDSTSIEPAPSGWVKGFLSLPAGNRSLKDGSGLSGGALISPVGATAGSWDLTLNDPTVDPNPIISKELRVNVNNNIATIFWLRARTSYGEVPVDDRTVALKVIGEVERV